MCRLDGQSRPLDVPIESVACVYLKLVNWSQDPTGEEEPRSAFRLKVFFVPFVQRKLTSLSLATCLQEAHLVGSSKEFTPHFRCRRRPWAANQIFGDCFLKVLLNWLFGELETYLLIVRLTGRLQGLELGEEQARLSIQELCRTRFDMRQRMVGALFLFFVVRFESWKESRIFNHMVP